MATLTIQQFANTMKCGYVGLNLSEDDKEKLNELGFFVDKQNNQFKSFRYGSA